jgi:hypothetical protein
MVFEIQERCLLLVDRTNPAVDARSTAQVNLDSVSCNTFHFIIRRYFFNIDLCHYRMLLRMGVPNKSPDFVAEFNESPWVQEPLTFAKLLSYHTATGTFIRLGDVVRLRAGSSVAAPTNESLWRIESLNYEDVQRTAADIEDELNDDDRSEHGEGKEEKVEKKGALPERTGRLGRGIPPRLPPGMVYTDSSSSSGSSLPHRSRNPKRIRVQPGPESAADHVSRPNLVLTLTHFRKRNTPELRYSWFPLFSFLSPFF